VEIYQEFGFDAAHRFPGAPEGHRNQGLHGHSFVARIVLAGAVDPRTGFIADLGEVERRCLACAPDHNFLNEIAGLRSQAREPRGIWNDPKPGFGAVSGSAARVPRHGCV
jgi:6-pyruvoyltetrahydropterin/6-carboxytetrahydropterin synthase